MDVVEAHARLALRQDRSLLPYKLVMGLQHATGVTPFDGWPLFAASLASLSGMLEDAKTDDDLTAALQHGVYLFEEKIVSAEDADAETNLIFAALMLWGERHEKLYAGPATYAVDVLAN